jgi:hypothetical protein
MSRDDSPKDMSTVAGSTNTGHLTRIFEMAENKGTPVLIKKSAPTSHLPKAPPPSSTDGAGASVPTSHLPTAAPSQGGGDKK